MAKKIKILNLFLEFVIGSAMIAAIIWINFIYFNFLFAQNSVFAVALFILWLILGSWTSLIGIVLGGIIVLFDYLDKLNW